MKTGRYVAEIHGTIQSIKLRLDFLKYKKLKRIRVFNSARIKEGFLLTYIGDNTLNINSPLNLQRYKSQMEIKPGETYEVKKTRTIRNKVYIIISIDGKDREFPINEFGYPID